MDEFSDHFAEVADPRAANARHDFLEVIFIALAAVLCSAEDCTDMAQFGRSKRDLLRQVLKLEHGVPSHDTFSRVFRLRAPEPFEAAFTRFSAAFAGTLKAWWRSTARLCVAPMSAGARLCLFIWSTFGQPKPGW